MAIRYHKNGIWIEQEGDKLVLLFPDDTVKTYVSQTEMIKDILIGLPDKDVREILSEYIQRNNKKR